MLKIERINFFFENAIRGGGPKSRYPPPSEIFKNAIRGGPNKWFLIKLIKNHL